MSYGKGAKTFQEPNGNVNIPMAFYNVPTNEPDSSLQVPDEYPAKPEAIRPAKKTDFTQRILLLFMLTAFFTLVFTTIPVVVKLPPITQWFSSEDLFRLFDPLFTLPLNFFLLASSDLIMFGDQQRSTGLFSKSVVVTTLWAIGAAIYVQGHGIHLTCVMMKHPIEQFNLANPDIVAQQPILNDIYLYMEDLWEHKIAHYMYAFGGMWMSWCVIAAYRDQIHRPLAGAYEYILWFLGILFYGGILAGVAIEFPYGLYVGLVYCIVLSATLLFILLRTRIEGVKNGAAVISPGRKLVLQSYFWSCILSLIVQIIWIVKYGFLNRKAAGLS